jgi:hypothetical protein
MANVTETVNKTMKNTVDRVTNMPERTEGGVGEWVPTILLLGVYNKIVKVAGSDRFDHGPGLGIGVR